MIGWKEELRPQILERGRKYASDGAVSDLKDENGRITALVRGSEYYKVDIRHVAGGVTDAYCSCPYAANGEWCKHIAAVLYSVESGEEKPEKSKESHKNHLGRSIHPVTPIRTIIESADRKELEAILIDLANSDIRVESIIRASLEPESPLGAEQIKKEIDEVFYSYGDRFGFINYHNAFSFESDLDSLLTSGVRSLMESGRHMDAFDISTYAYVRLGNQDIDDDGEISLLSDTCYELWTEILMRCSPEEKETIRQWFMKHSGDGTVIDYMEDTLQDFLRYELASEDELRTEIRKLEKIISSSQGQTGCEKVYSSHYGYNVEAIELRNILAKKLGASDHEIEEYMRDHMSFRSVRNYFIEKAAESGDVSEEIRLLKESKKYDADSIYDVHAYSERLIEIYAAIGDHDSEKRERRDDITYYQNASLDEYKAYRDMCTNKEWLKERRRIIDSRESIEKKCEFLAEEKMLDELFNTIWEQEPKLELINKYGFLLAEKYSAEILDYYSQYISDLAEVACNRSRYDNMKRYLLRMAQYPGGEQLARCISAQWEAMYPTRKVMIQEMRKLWEKVK